ncbi:MAG TPA: (2Fe-2S)-binding protein [Dehalococcoidia bacterium]|jgi:bacterioferritin-associated ferredoxin|nr:(2Fe-2S)-binding protein [Dehalococcoidia bacterium]
MYVCLCKGITDRQVRSAGLAGVITPAELVRHFGLDDEECCGFCEHNIFRMVAIARGEDPMHWGKFKLDPAYQVPIDDPDLAP